MTTDIDITLLDELLDRAADTGESFTPRQMLTVALVFRAVDMLAGAVSRMPFYVVDANDNDVTDDVMSRYWIDLQYKLCASYLMFNSAYALIETNRFGLNARYRFLPSNLVTYQINSNNNQIDYFEYRVGTQRVRITDYNKTLLWWWRANLFSEVGPGTGPADAALGDAALVRSLTQFAGAYFKRGGFPITILQMKNNPPDQEKILRWWNSLISGARRAFRAILLTDQIEPKIIGSNIRDTIAPDLFSQAARNVAIAFGIPLSLLMSDAANYATALSDHVRFYTETVLPMADWLYEVWAERVFEPQGLTLKTDPSKLEIMQAYQLQQAEAVSKLVGAPLLSVDEGREIIGYRPRNVVQADAGTSGNETTGAEAEPAPAVETTPGEAQAAASRSDAISQERDRLKRYAHNRLRDGKEFAFKSDVIGLAEIEAVRACRTHEAIDALAFESFAPASSSADIKALIEAVNAAREALGHE